jgi:serine/tyrosine/threonine adenylyltransferase
MCSCHGHAGRRAALQEWVAWLNEWREALQAHGTPDGDRQAQQRAVNPCYVPRQHLLQYAIDAATQGDYSELRTLLKVLENPFTEQEGREKYAQPPPAEMVKPGICQLSCSS